MNLIYQVSDKYSPILDNILGSGELTEDQLNELRLIEENPTEKVINDAAIIKNLESEQLAIESAIEDMERRKECVQNKIERIKLQLKMHMYEHNLKQVKTPYYDVNIRSNPPSTNISNEALIPSKYIKETIIQRIDRNLIMKDIKEGIEVPGVELQQNTRLDIK